MSYPSYPEYQDSGTDWLGDVPTHWEVKRLSHFFDERREKASDREYQPLSVTMEGIVPRLEHAAKTKDGDNRKKVLAGDFVINSRSDRKGSSGLSAYTGSVSLICIVLAPKGIVPEFAHHLLRSPLFQEEFYRNGKGIVADLWSTGFAEMKNIKVPSPTVDEQIQIARFLDHQTARIDALIAEQQRLIELLKEKRQAVISHAVTKGLDPDMTMKDSGVEWLGEVPEHWTTCKASYLGRFFGSEPVADNEIVSDGNIPVLKVASLSKDSIEVKEWEWHVEPERENTYRPHSNFVAFPKRGAAIFINKVNVVRTKALLDPNLMGWKVNPDVCLDYMAYSLKCRDISDLADVSTVPQINNKHIAPEKFPCPPRDEQERISSFIDRRTYDFEELITTALQAVDLLEERRSALISAAVTGKIDVRDWEPPVSETFPQSTVSEEVSA